MDDFKVREVIFLKESEHQILGIIKRAIDPNCHQEINLDLDWEKVFAFGKLHKINPVLCEGLLSADLDATVKKRFSDDYLKQALVHFSQANKLISLTNAFDENGIDYMIVKGSRLKALYPKPEMRVMVDMDILIRVNQYEKIKKCMLDLGFFEKGESDHEFIWDDNRFVNIELHKRLFPSYNPDFAKYFGTGWERTKKQSEESCSFLMSPEDEYIFVFTHFAKHYRDGGIGIRHMLDLYLFEKRYPELDNEYIAAELTKLGLCEFYRNIKNTLLVWFEDGEATEIASHITERIFSSGAYGTTERGNQANALRVKNRSKTLLGGKLKFIIQTAFPPLEAMKKKFGFLEKLPVLLPFAWIVRIFKGVFFKQKTLKKTVSELESIKSEMVESYQEELKKVGLSDNF